jgi:hypothetical protein
LLAELDITTDAWRAETTGWCPGQNDLVTFTKALYPGASGFYQAGTLMTEYGWKLNPLNSGQRTEVTSADSAGLHLDSNFTGTRVIEFQFFD